MLQNNFLAAIRSLCLRKEKIESNNVSVISFQYPEIFFKKLTLN